MNTHQRKFRWKISAIALVAAVTLTFLLATFFPWLALLSAIVLLTGGIAYAAWPAMSEKIASLRSLPSPSLQRRIYIAVPFVVYGIILLVLSQSQIRANWRAADIRAEVVREIDNANAALEKEQLDEALRLCSLIESKANADEKTQLDAIRARARTIQNAHRTEIANREVAELVTSSRESLENMNRDEAAGALEKALAISDATETAEAEKMFAGIQEARGAEANARVATLMADAQRLIDAKEFDDAIRALNAALAVPHSTRNSEVTAKIRLAQEQQAAEKERAIALAKAAELAAQRQAVEKRQKQNLDRFMARLSAAGIGNSVIDSVSVKGDTATITVVNAWHLSAYQIRLQAAQNLWKLWASIASPTEPDKARIKLVDFNDNEVGGSRILAGSLIWVQDN